MSEQELGHRAYGRVEQIIGRLYQKQELLRVGNTAEAEKIRPIVYFMGGGHMVSNEVGFGEELYRQGLFDVMTAVIGASGGSVVMAHSVTGNTNAVRILQDNCKQGFVGFQHTRLRNPAVVNFVGFEQTLRRSPVNKDEMRNVIPDVLAVATSLERGGGIEAFDLKTAPDLEQVLLASCLIPSVGNVESVKINGRRYIDGGLPGIPYAIMDAHHPTDVLIFASGPIEKSSQDRQISQWLAGISKRMPNRSLQLALSSFYDGEYSVGEAFRRNCLEDSENPVNYGLIVPTNTDVGTFTMHWPTIEQAINTSRRSARRFFPPREDALSISA